MSAVEDSTGAFSPRGPMPDQPFPGEVIRYCAERLYSLGIQADRGWLLTDTCSQVLLWCGQDQQKMAAEARKSVPRSEAIWETSDFYRWTMPLAMFDVRSEAMQCFEHFALLYIRILGDEARRWLPSVYLAAIGSPFLLPESRIRCFNRFVDERLDVEQEISW